ncbi:MAG: DUF6095 family protein [Marinirhabdus sp.]
MNNVEKTKSKKLVLKGLKKLAFSVLLIVLSTYILTFAFLNKETIPLYVFLPLGIVVMAVTIYTLFKAIKQIVNALFESK